MVNPDPIHESVRKHYAERIQTDSSCCASSNCCSSSASFYPSELLSSLPISDSIVSYGCGDPVTLASLQEGQTVLDLGCGAGLDCFLAAQKVGPSGFVIGVDMTPEMIQRATATAARLQLSNVEFRQGYLEDLPVESDSVDVIISNCVINLSPDKPKVFAEAYRVLKPGGRLAVSDIVTAGPLPSEIKQSLTAWAGCIAGAMDAEEMLSLMETIGFKEIVITPDYYDPAVIDSVIAELELDTSAFSPQELYKSVFSARISATK
ncbi:MAG: arsenite methyltransferase [Chloroflexota bacterium]